jgi:hypothetical protein
MAYHGSEPKSSRFWGTELMRMTVADQQTRQTLTFSAHICAQLR